MSKDVPIQTLCKLMQINRSGYYKWKSRYGKLNHYEQNRKNLTKLLKDAHDRHKTYGYHRLAQLIRNETGWIFSDNLAHQCCKQARIIANGRKTYRAHRGKEHVKFQNMINGKWNASRPMEIVVSDMTVLKNKKGGRYEWTYILDTFNNEIIASSLSRREGDTKPYFDCINTLVQKAKEQTLPVLLHTDQGSVYSSRAFYAAHADCTNILRSMSRVATPTDNPIIEALNGWIKEELYIDFGLYHTHDVPTLIENYIHYFNYQRISSKCKGKSPIQFKAQFGF